MRGNIHTRLDRLEAMTPAPSGSPEARARMVDAVETLKDLVLEHADEIDCDYRERVVAGQDDKEGPVAAKMVVWERTAEGRAALELLDAVRDRGGG